MFLAQHLTATADETNRTWVRELIRWACVLPAAVLASTVVHSASGIMAMVITSILGTAAGPAVVYWIKFAMFYVSKKAAFVLVGALTAPRYRLSTAVALAALASGTSLMVHVLGQRSVGPTNYSHLAAETAGAVCGIVCVALVIRPSKTG